tara:strand:- start:178 stop:384 length:207 start_codon:yes stop_codon:yes gene_type:complete
MPLFSFYLMRNYNLRLSCEEKRQIYLKCLNTNNEKDKNICKSKLIEYMKCISYKYPPSVIEHTIKEYK